MGYFDAAQEVGLRKLGMTFQRKHPIFTADSYNVFFVICCQVKALHVFTLKDLGTKLRYQ